MLKRNFLSLAVASGMLCVSSMALDLPANKLVDAKWLDANKADKSLVIIDIRDDKKAYKKSHIPNAIHWSTKEFREKRYGDAPGYLPAPLTFTRLMKKSGITKDSNVVFYSDGKEGDSYTIAGLGVYITEYYGFKNTAILNGGFASWKAANLAVDANKVKPVKSEWEITAMNTQNLANSSDIDEAVVLGNDQLLDARGDGQAFGDKKHKKVKKAGHLPGAKHVFVGKFTTNDNGVYKIIDEKAAQKVLQDAKVDMQKPLIWYCNSGWYASGDWFVGKYVAKLKDTKVYDGSMIDYTRLPKRKLVKGKF